MTYDNSNPGSRPLPPMAVEPARAGHTKTWVIAGITALVVLGIVAWSMPGTNNTTANTPSITSAPVGTTGIAPSTPAPAAPTK
jgi:hypothetical protein